MVQPYDVELDRLDYRVSITFTIKPISILPLGWSWRNYFSALVALVFRD